MRQTAVRSFADALGSGAGDAFERESDLDLVEGALPFTLKALETLQAQVPEHRGLYLSLARGYMLYANAFVDHAADELKYEDPAEYARLKARARRLYRRAHRYALLGLVCGSAANLPPDGPVSDDMLAGFDRFEDVAYLYWCGVSLAKAISLAKTDPGAMIRLPEAAAFVRRASEVNPDFNEGALHEFFISYEARGAAMGGSRDRVTRHFERARELAAGKRVSPLLTYVEAVCIPQQDRETFSRYIEMILEFDYEAAPQNRLANELARRRALYLQRIQDNLFIGEE